MKRVLVGLGLLAILMVSLGAGVPQPQSYPLEIEVLGTNGDQPQKVPTSGWLITIVLKAIQEPLGIARRTLPPQFPELNNSPCEAPDSESILTGGGFMVFSDQDGQVSMLNPSCLSPIETTTTVGCSTGYFLNPLRPFDETFLEFIPGTRPPINQATTGFSSRLPGLVLLSDTGIGNKYDGNGRLNPTPPRKALNLAANINSVGYIFRDGTGMPAITATIAAPPGLVTPNIEVDFSVGPKADCPNVTDLVWFRIDGGAIKATTQSEYVQAIRAQVEAMTSTFRFFVVNAMNGPSGIAEPPKQILDKDGDGVVTAQDASLMRFTLLSEERSVRFKVHYDIFLPFSPADLDNNGCKGAYVAPGGAGGLVRLPE